MAKEVPTVVHKRFTGSVTFLGVVSNESDMMLPHFFPQFHRVGVTEYTEVLDTPVK